MKKILTIACLVFTLAPLASTRAASPDFEISGWIPYWSVVNGTRSATKHLSTLAEINPFGFSIKTDGSLNDLADLKKNDWNRLFKKARAAEIRLVPTVMASDGDLIHSLLSNSVLRAKHIANIVEMVKKGKYDGVDIDYEAKKFETKEYFSAFLVELKTALGSKLLSCTVEPRTPPDSLYTTPRPEGSKYVNDYAVIGAVCDRVKIMAYDQRNADIKLNAAKGASDPYLPIADADWVSKVVNFTLQTIPAEKVVLGVATYGHEYEVTKNTNGKLQYQRLWSVNPEYATKQAKKVKEKPVRQSSGEIGYTYRDKKAAKGVVNYVTWSDAEAIRQKVELAERLGLRGVAIFKIDGGEDTKLWQIW